LHYKKILLVDDDDLVVEVQDRFCKFRTSNQELALFPFDKWARIETIEKRNNANDYRRIADNRLVLQSWNADGTGN